MGALTAEERKGIAAVSLQTAFAIVTFFVAKDALAFVDAGPLVLLRAGLAGLLLAALVPLGVGGGTRPEWRPGDLLRLAALGVLIVPLNQMLFFVGLQRTTAAHAALLYGLTPAMVLLLGVARGTERLTRTRVLGIVLAFAGVVFVLTGRPGEEVAQTGFAQRQRAGADALTGDLVILLAVIAWAVYTAFSRELVSRLGTLRATAGAMGLGALVFVPFALPSAAGVDWAGVPTSVWVAIGWLVIGSSTISYLAWYYAIRRLEPSRVAIFNNLQPLGTALIAWALGARPGPALFAGAALVIAGVVLAQRR